MGIRKVQYAPAKPGPQPCTVVRKDFVLSPGQLELELTLDKQVSRYLDPHEPPQFVRQYLLDTKLVRKTVLQTAILSVKILFIYRIIKGIE